jgi:uncharacterized protein YigE (DUF2233 family)
MIRLPAIFLFLLFFSCSDTTVADEKAPGTVNKQPSNPKNGSKEFEDASFIFIKVHPSKDSIRMFWKDDNGKKLEHLPQLARYLQKKGKTLHFGMNAGMYTTDLSPLGLYIEQGKLVKKAVTKTSGYGNFYIQPGGIFYIREKTAGISIVPNFNKNAVLFATQSGPMLLIDKKINSNFNPSSQNKNIRNGVGILPSGEVVFAISRVPVSFYEFAVFFKEAGCTNALYLDGGISAVLYPEKDLYPAFHPGFGVMIGVVK